jgi:hypothetical protein
MSSGFNEWDTKHQRTKLVLPEKWAVCSDCKDSCEGIIIE